MLKLFISVSKIPFIALISLLSPSDIYSSHISLISTQATVLLLHLSLVMIWWVVPNLWVMGNFPLHIYKYTKSLVQDSLQHTHDNLLLEEEMNRSRIDTYQKVMSIQRLHCMHLIFNAQHILTIWQLSYFMFKYVC